MQVKIVSWQITEEVASSATLRRNAWSEHVLSGTWLCLGRRGGGRVSRSGPSGEGWVLPRAGLAGLRCRYTEAERKMKKDFGGIADATPFFFLACPYPCGSTLPTSKLVSCTREGGARRWTRILGRSRWRASYHVISNQNELAVASRDDDNINIMRLIICYLY